MKLSLPRYDEPFFRWGSWLLLIHDHGWFVAKDSSVKYGGRWPSYWTFRPWLQRPPSQK